MTCSSNRPQRGHRKYPLFEGDSSCSTCKISRWILFYSNHASSLTSRLWHYHHWWLVQALSQQRKSGCCVTVAGDPKEEELLKYGPERLDSCATINPLSLNYGRFEQKKTCARLSKPRYTFICIRCWPEFLRGYPQPWNCQIVNSHLDTYRRGRGARIIHWVYREHSMIATIAGSTFLPESQPSMLLLEWLWGHCLRTLLDIVT